MANHQNSELPTVKGVFVASRSVYAKPQNADKSNGTLVFTIACEDGKYRDYLLPLGGEPTQIGQYQWGKLKYLARKFLNVPAAEVLTVKGIITAVVKYKLRLRFEIVERRIPIAQGESHEIVEVLRIK